MCCRSDTAVTITQTVVTIAADTPWLNAVIRHEPVADDFRLLFKAVAVELTAGFDSVAVAAERMTHKRQEITPALLRLPDMGHFVDKQALQRQALGRKIVGP